MVNDLLGIGIINLITNKIKCNNLIIQITNNTFYQKIKFHLGNKFPE